MPRNSIESLGYQISGKLENWDFHGHTKFLFTKPLTAVNVAKL